MKKILLYFICLNFFGLSIAQSAEERTSSTEHNLNEIDPGRNDWGGLSDASERQHSDRESKMDHRARDSAWGGD